MEADPSQALEMLNAFKSVGAYVFDITLTDLDGKMLEKDFFRSRTARELRRTALRQLPRRP